MKEKAGFERPLKTFVRKAEPNDLDRLVELEFETFEDVYETYPADPTEVREMIATRMTIIPDLMIVGEVDGVIEGVMACQRTDKSSDQVRSWEETTNNGMLVGTHKPEGKNFYIVNLAVSKKGSEHDLSDKLIANMMGRFVEAQGEEAHLLSRIPQFSEWLEDQQIDFDSLDTDTQDTLAEQYVCTTKVVNGRERLYDGVLQRYVDAGVKPIAVLRDSYTDPRSRNYEVLCVFENPLPETFKRNRMASRLAGKVLQYAANHPAILDKLL